MNISQDMQSARAMAPQVEVAVGKKASGSGATALEPIVGDQTHLSGAASLASQAASVPDVRQEKVTSVQTALADGTYSVKSDEVAQSLMHHLLGKKF